MPGHAADTESLRAEMRVLVRQAAEPAVAGEGVKAAIARAARRLGFSYGRTKRYWYQEVLHPFAVDVERARAGRGGQAVRRRLTRRSTERLEACQGVFLYDGDGRAWNLGSPDLGDAIGRGEAELNVDRGEYAVRCLGWVQLAHSRGRLNLRVAPEMARPNALHSALETLALVQSLDVSISTWQQGHWSQSSFTEPHLAARHLVSLLDRPRAS